MKVPLGWLKDFVELREDAAAVAHALVGAGVGVEAIEGSGDDAVLDLEITSNRADLLSMSGVGRELGLVLGRPLKELSVDHPASGSGAAVPIRIEDRAFCRAYIGRVIQDVSAGPSPGWMRNRLEQAGVRAINLPADITNYVMLECGQPLHAFDLSKVAGRKIVVRRARPGEKMRAIDGKEYALTAGDGVIADESRSVAIAGVMGGQDSEITGATKEVLLESAWFDPVSVRRTSRRLGLKSESSYRFERGVDLAGVAWASRRAEKLLVELAGGRAHPKEYLDGESAAPAGEITLRTARVGRVLGMEVPAARLRQILEGLGCRIERSDSAAFAVRPPSARRDLKDEIDLIEEIARIEGYDKVPTDLGLPVRVVTHHPSEWVRDEIRKTLSASGAFEVLTSAFEDVHAGASPVPWQPEAPIVLRNPDGHPVFTLRTSLARALLTVLRTNEGSKEPLRPVFELSKCYRPCPPAGPHDDADLGADRAPFDERMVLAVAAPGGYSEARALVERVLSRLQVPHRIDREGRVASGGRELGHVAVLPELLAAVGLQARAAVAELRFDELVRLALPVRKVRVHSVHPAVERDLSLVFEEKVPWGDVEAAARAAGGPHLASVDMFDIFRDKRIGEGRKSVAFRLRFLAPDRTLTGPEVDGAVSAVREALKSRLGALER